jgi:hypothetical protein
LAPGVKYKGSNFVRILMPEEKPTRRQPLAVRDLSGVLKDAPPGAWAALSRDWTRLVASGATMHEATDLARLNGENDPILIRTPFADEGLAAESR